MADLREVGRLLALRYNVKEVDGPLADAIAAGDVDEVERLISEREMYQWTAPLAKAIAAARGADVQDEPEASEPEPEEAEAITEPVPEPETAPPAAEVEEPAPEPKKAGRGKKK